MKQMRIFLMIQAIIICSLPIHVLGAEARKGLCVVNQCPGNIEISYSFPLANEYTTISHGGNQLIEKGQRELLPLGVNLLCIKIGELYTNHLLIEEEHNPLLVTKSVSGEFVTYQNSRSSILRLQPQQKKDIWCLLQ